MTIFNQYELLETHPTKTHQPNDPTCTQKNWTKKKKKNERC